MYMYLFILETSSNIHICNIKNSYYRSIYTIDRLPENIGVDKKRKKKSHGSQNDWMAFSPK
jgi:hypothetical protein